MSPKEIKALRTAYGESQEKFGRRVGVTRNTVWMWEAGTSTPTGPAMRLLHLLARGVGKEGE